MRERVEMRVARLVTEEGALLLIGILEWLTVVVDCDDGDDGLRGLVDVD